MISVGIDVGTTTTQLVFSNLTLSEVSRPGAIPRVGITVKEILYESGIHFTPLRGADEVDVVALDRLVRAEYATAGITPADVETGAVIITGETAKKRNADAILAALADLAGDFVVTIAGPHVESMIAGRGSGAAAYSRTNFTTVTNVDIGGGSANSAVFRNGNMIAAAAMNYGGRILMVDHDSGRITHVAGPAQRILDHLGLRLRVGDTPTLEQLRRFCACMADLTVELIEGPRTSLGRDLMLTPPPAVSGAGTVLSFSGGIGLYYYDPLPIRTVADVAVHGDVGPLLAEMLRQHTYLNSYRIERPPQTLRATVLGASSQTVTLSGSTIWAESEVLPLRNLPVVRPHLNGAGADRLPDAIIQAVQRWDLDPDEADFAVALELEERLNYARLLALAHELAHFAASHRRGRPLVIIIEKDYAQALGQTIKALLPQQAVIAIDQVGLQEGDYIDIGRPLLDGRVVPLSVKTLIFYS
jgi:ethanolamine utilization protein EutA